MTTLLDLFPIICEEWDYKKNDKHPSEYTPNSNKNVWWKCKFNPCGCHFWKTQINNRTRNRSQCPYCNKNKVCQHNNLKVHFPIICEEWDYDRNENPPTSYTKFSIEKVWWVCKDNPCGCHNWKARIGNRTSRKSGCPFCDSIIPCKHNNFAVKNPTLVNEWDYKKKHEISY